MAHAGAAFGRPAGRPVAAGGAGSVAVVVTAGFLLRYDHSAAFLRRMNPNIAYLPGARG
ncbi:hypothetical protein AB0C02_03960 [Micromonospora sp. NPDC048999]|uniref:hypothetical protein n=1 Tax=Micromonospora sp. NPDC048999 TaxID=3155391 RepID=UPI0033FDF607